mmetsp:Transcript_19972/g.28415  ORF Transcript_19972/g.28415 Transcript_19972/m.28415 type:complete len:285 (+) Transcript_19972:38-892(+)
MIFAMSKSFAIAKRLPKQFQARPLREASTIKYESLLLACYIRMSRNKRVVRSMQNNFGATTTQPVCINIASMSTAAYGGEPGDGTKGVKSLTYIPYSTKLPDGTDVALDTFRSEEEYQVGMDLMNLIIREGRTWPFEKEFENLESYKGYFLSHAAFVVRDVQQNIVLGCFYVKPNFPGRCSHICNGGFITSPSYRNRGVATLMGSAFLQIAKDLQYKSAYFNLVFKSNTASVYLWEKKLGFQRVAILEKAGRLKGLDHLDTAYGYRFDLETLDRNYLFQTKSKK